MTPRTSDGDPSDRSAWSVDSLPELLGAGRSADVALVSAETGETLTFGELRDRIASLAMDLRTAGVSRGDRVALVLPNGLDYVQCVLAITQLGAAAAPLNPAYTSTEHEFYLRDLTPRLLLLPNGQFKAAREGADPELAIGELVVDEARGLTIDPGRPQASEAADGADADDIALLLHTSGTTSRPKLVPLLHRNLVASTLSIARHYQLSSEDVSYCAMPLFHVHGLLACVLAPLSVGARVVVPTRSSPTTFWQSLSRDGVRWFSAAPTLQQMLLDKRPATAPTPRSLGLRFVRTCSSALSSTLFARIEEEYEAPVLEAYGMTEASHQIASNPLPPRPRFPHSVGVPVGSEAEVLGTDGAFLGAGQPGEVVIRGPGVMPGYLDNPEATAEAFHNGWFRTGDRGTIDDQGYVRLEGRIKELIIRGGENISPSEIEDVLLRHPAVAEAVCFGVPDAKYGESVGAGIVLKAKADADELLRHCRDSLASYKIPTLMRFIDEVPRTATGKPRRREAAALLTDGEPD